jgi:hypothetical protein
MVAVQTYIHVFSLVYFIVTGLRVWKHRNEPDDAELSQLWYV